MKPGSPRWRSGMSGRDGSRRGAARGDSVRCGFGQAWLAWIFCVSLCLASPGLAAAADPGRLFYTPAQRAQLENARARNVTQPSRVAADSAPPVVRFDGVVIRSDGKGTRWINGRPRPGTSPVAALKPGQIRARGRVYEPYQVLQPRPAAPAHSEPAP